MTEAEFLKKVTKHADDNGITWVHIPDSRRVPSSKGMPDLFLIGKYRCIWRELKLDGEKPQGEQVRWKYLLISAGQDYEVWTPRDLGRIPTELANLNRPPSLR